MFFVCFLNYPLITGQVEILKVNTANVLF